MDAGEEVEAHEAGTQDMERKIRPSGNAVRRNHVPLKSLYEALIPRTSQCDHVGGD